MDHFFAWGADSGGRMWGRHTPDSLGLSNTTGAAATNTARVAALPASASLVLTPGRWPFGAGTIRCRIIVEDGGVIAPTGVLVVTGPFEAGFSQCITTALGGSLIFGGSTNYFGSGVVHSAVPQWWGAQANALTGTAAIGAGSADLTATAALFSASSVGLTLTILGAGPAGVPLTSTIATYTSPTEVTLADVATVAVAAGAIVFGHDDTAALQAAVDAGVTQATGKGCPVFLPKGSYLTTATITVPQGGRIFGAGRRWTRITCGEAVSVIKLDGTLAAIYWCELDGFLVNGLAAAGGAAAGIEFVQACESRVDRVDVYNCTIGVKLGANCISDTLERILVKTSGTGIQAAAGCNDLSLRGVKVDTVTARGVELTGDCQRVYADVTVQKAGTSGFYAETVRTLFLTGYLEQNNTTAAAGEGAVRLDHAYGAMITATFWTKKELASVILDHATGVEVVGCAQGDLVGSTCVIFVQTSATCNAVTVGLNAKTQPNNDVGGVIVNLGLRPVLPTGAGKTVDNVITALQQIGLVKQA